MTTAMNVSDASSDARQMLTFRLGEEGYGVDILRVKEIRGGPRSREFPSRARTFWVY